MVALTKKHPRVHPHPACGHLLPEGEGINGDALGQAACAWRDASVSLSQREKTGERENA